MTTKPLDGHGVTLGSSLPPESSAVGIGQQYSWGAESYYSESNYSAEVSATSAADSFQCADDDSGNLKQQLTIATNFGARAGLTVQDAGIAKSATALPLDGEGVKLGTTIPSQGIVVGSGQQYSKSIGTYYAGTNFVIGAGVNATVSDYAWPPVYDYNGILAESPVTITNFGLVNFNTEENGVTIGILHGGTFANFGTVGGGDLGAFSGQAHFTNGSPTDTTATMSGGVTVSTYNVVNFGTITLAQSGGDIAAWAIGGNIVNGSSLSTAATIYGYTAADAVSGNITNFGSIISHGKAGVAADVGSEKGGKPGTIVNGSLGVPGALIAGYSIGADAGRPGIGASGTIINFGTIIGTHFAGASAGTIINGALTDTSASISGADGAGDFNAPGDGFIQNFGTIAAIGTGGIGVDQSLTLINGAKGYNVGVVIGSSIGVYTGNVTNFGRIIATDTDGIGINSFGSTIKNYGTIAAVAGAQSQGLYTSGSPITNFAGGLIEGSYIGAHFGSGTLTNSGEIRGTGSVATGVEISSGSVTNASTGTISGARYGVYVTSTQQGVQIVNYGLIRGAIGVLYAGGGPLTNGGTIVGTAGTAVSLHNANASLTLLPGATFIGLVAATSGDNRITLDGTGVTGSLSGLGSQFQNFSALYVEPGASWQLVGKNTISVPLDSGTLEVTGSFGSASGIEVAGTLVSAGTFYSAGTLINAGTIGNASGIAGTAVQLGGVAARLVLDPGAKFIGAVVGAGATNVLELAAGAAAGSMVGSQFANFGSLVVDGGATWTVTGSDTIGTLADNGSLTVAGSLDVSGSLAPASTGMLALGATATLEVASVLGSGPAIHFLTDDKLIVDAASDFGLHVGGTGYIGPLLENFAPSDAIDLTNIADSGLVLNYATASGLLTITKHNGAGVASLLFQTSSLGAGTWHIAPDAGTGTLITHG